MLNKMILDYERSCSYVVASQRHLLPAAGVPGSRYRLAVLTILKRFDDMLWSLWSWLKVLEGAAKPVIFVDGPVTLEMRTTAARLFPEAPVTELAAYLAGEASGPSMTRFIASHPLGKRLAMVLAMNHSGPVLYSDSDVIAFNRLDEQLAAIANGRACYLQEEEAGGDDDRVVAAARALGTAPVASMNSGLMDVPESVLDGECAETVMERFAAKPPSEQTRFSEQPLDAILMGPIPALIQPRETYVASIRRQFFLERDCDYCHIKVHHLIGTIRHVMYIKGLPLLLSRMTS
jgi:hypothetical protein